MSHAVSGETLKYRLQQKVCLKCGTTGAPNKPYVCPRCIRMEQEEKRAAQRGSK